MSVTYSIQYRQSQEHMDVDGRCDHNVHCILEFFNCFFQKYMQYRHFDKTCEKLMLQRVYLRIWQLKISSSRCRLAVGQFKLIALFLLCKYVSSLFLLMRARIHCG